MSRVRRAGERGGALVLVTLSLLAMCGIMGLAVDLGWSYFVRKSAQSAADAAALTAARNALKTVGQVAAFNCAANVDCSPAPVACSGAFTRNLATTTDGGCWITTQNGFSVGGNSGRQNVTFAADVVTGAPPACAAGTPNCIPTVPGIVPLYWATTRVTENVPQLFSAVLGNYMGSVSARATGVVIGIGIEDSIIVTNRENDASPGANVGNNIYIQGGGGIVVPGGIKMASAANGPGNNYAGYTGGSGTVTSGTYVRIRGASSGPLTGVNDPSKWNPTPVNRIDGKQFHDPYEGKGQPPIGTTPLPNCPVLNGVLPANAVLAPGNYYAVNNAGTPTGAPLTIGGSNASVRFTAAATSSPIDYSAGRATSTCMGGVAGSGANFGGDHILYGGIDLSGSGGTMTVEPGRYVVAGTVYSGNANNVQLMNLGQNGSIVDLISGQTPSASDPGTLFILTDANYAGLSTQLATIPALNAIRSTLEFARTNLQGGTNSVGVRLHGLNDQNSVTQSVADQNTAGATLKDFGTVAFWQDQRNTSVQYDSSGRIVGNINNPSTSTLTHPTLSPEFFYQGSANSTLWGTIYQPRGAWMRLQGGGQSAGNNRTRIVTGALRIGGSSTVSFGNLASPITVRIAALVE
jgi:hypothetical protein